MISTFMDLDNETFWIAQASINCFVLFMPKLETNRLLIIVYGLRSQIVFILFFTIVIVGFVTETELIRIEPGFLNRNRPRTGGCGFRF